MRVKGLMSLEKYKIDTHLFIYCKSLIIFLNYLHRKNIYFLYLHSYGNWIRSTLRTGHLT